MSATNRGADRVEHDAYPTPSWATRRLLERVRLPAGRWLEPCAGEGAIVQVVEGVIGRRDWTLCDIRDTATVLQAIAPDACVEPATDYLTADFGHHAVAITNPPFGLAVDIIKRALTQADHVVMLLRLNFLGSDDRANWLRHEMPDIYTLPDRPNFVASYKCKARDKHDRGCGWHTITAINAPRIKTCPVCGRDVQRSTSDSAEYCWAHWTPERGRRAGRVCILDSTPAAERSAA